MSYVIDALKQLNNNNKKKISMKENLKEAENNFDRKENADDEWLKNIINAAETTEENVGEEDFKDEVEELKYQIEDDIRKFSKCLRANSLDEVVAIINEFYEDNTEFSNEAIEAVAKQLWEELEDKEIDMTVADHIYGGLRNAFGEKEVDDTIFNLMSDEMFIDLVLKAAERMDPIKRQ